MGKAETGEEANEAGGTGGGSTGSIPGALEGGTVAASKSGKSTFREYAEALLIALILALLIRTFLVQAFKIPSGSMMDTLQIGDHILVNKFSYGVKIPFTDDVLVQTGKPEAGDIVVFKFPDDERKDFIKRVVGVPGDQIEIRNKQVLINDRPYSENYAVYKDPVILGRELPRDHYGPMIVPEDSYFVMGDNRDHSMDSRYWGFVNLNKIKGKTFLIYWSWVPECKWTRKCSWVRWDRVFNRI